MVTFETPTTPPTEPTWTAARIVAEYRDFFRERGHLEVPGSPLVAPGGTSFTIAGMQPFIPYFRGAATPPAARLTDIQRCLRTPDADEVGTNGRKLTCFHMLGNWSIGDYGRREAIDFARELLDRFGLDWSTLYVTTFAGDPALGLPPDEETVALWRERDVPREHIVPLGSEDNLWTLGGPGPCGPCTEIFVDQGAARGCGQPDCRPGCACERFLEIWNLVFIEHELLPDHTVRPLPLRSVDTGMGLERMAVVLQRVPTAFEIDLFAPAAARLAEIATVAVGEERQEAGFSTSSFPGRNGGQGIRSEVRARRMVLDHARAALFAMVEGIAPGRDGRASVVRRLIRRAARQGRILGLDGPFMGELVAPLAEAHAAFLTPEERERVPVVTRLLAVEERRFARVLTWGLRRLEGLRLGEDGLVPGADIFRLQAERGFPADLASEALAERGLAVDWQGYERAVEAHRAISRVSAERRFGHA
jgi:alanyl-tRNA synthetase